MVDGLEHLQRMVSIMFVAIAQIRKVVNSIQKLWLRLKGETMNKEAKARLWFENNYYRGKEAIVEKIIDIMKGEE